MIKIINELKDINLNDYIIIVPPYMELFYKEKYIDYNYNISNINNFLMDEYNTSKRLVNKYVSYIIMDKVYNKLNNSLSYYTDITSNSFINDLLNTYDKYYEYEVNDSNKINDLNMLFNEFEKELSNNGYYTINMLYKSVIEENNFNGNYLFLSLSNLDRNELSLLNKMGNEGNVLLNINNNESLSNKLNGIGISNTLEDISFENKNVLYKSLNDLCDEVSFISNDISKKVKSDASLDDILIICPNTNIYEPYFSLYLNHPYNKNEYKGILTNRFVNSFCDLLYGDFSNSKFIEMLKLGIFDVDKKMVDKLDNYIYSWNLEDELFYIPFKYNPNGNKKSFTEKDVDDLDKLNDIKDSIIMPIKFLLENLKDVTNKTEMLKLIYTYLLEEKIINKLFNIDEEGVNNLISLFEYMNDYMEDEISIENVINVLKNNNLYDSKKESNINFIDIMNYDSSYLGNKKHVYLIGFINSDIPKTLNLPNLLTNDDVLKDDLIKKIDDNNNYSKYLFNTILSCDNVTITYPKLSSQLELTEECSYLNLVNKKEITDKEIYDINNFYKKYSILLSEEKTNKINNKIFEKINKSNEHNLKYKLDKNITEELYENVLNTSPSSIERYFKCPFYYFCESTLKLKVKEKYLFDSREVGTFVHYILEKIIKNDINEISVSNIDDLILKYSENYLEDHGKISNNTTKYVLRVLSKSTALIIKNIVNELRVTKFRPTYFEFKIGDDKIVKPLEIKLDDKVIKIGGIIDRVDTYVDDNNYYFRIIDYKTGKKDFKLSDVLDGLNLQMLIYLLAIKESKISNLNIIPSALLYYPALIKEEKYKVGDNKDEILEKKMRMVGMVNKDDVDILEKDNIGRFINDTSRGVLNLQKTYDLDNLNNLFTYIKKMIYNMGKALYDGNIEVNPIGDKHDACLYCKYSSICKFDKKYDKKRKLKKYTNKEVFEMLGGDYNA